MVDRSRRRGRRPAAPPTGQTGPSRAPATPRSRAPGGKLPPVVLPPQVAQRKPRVGAADDPLEKEADRVADQVLAGQSAQRITSMAGGQAQPLRREESGEEEELQAKPLQRQEAEEEEEALQTLPVQRQPEEEEEELQTVPLQRQAEEEEEELQTVPLQRQAEEEEEQLQAVPLQRQPEEEEELQTLPLQRQAEEEELQTLPLQCQAEEEEELQTVPLQRQAEEEKEEELQTLPLQRQAEEEEEQLQTVPLQRQPEEEEEELQTVPLQRQAEEEEEQKETVAGEEEQSEEPGSDDQALGVELPEEEEVFQGRREPGSEERAAPGSVDRALAQRGSGQPVDASVRQRAERSTGFDLSGVRVHSDSAAHNAARDIDARAFTHGRDIWLGRGETQNDSRLMAHELTHVVQQSRLPAASSPVRRTAGDGDPARRFEKSGSVIDLDKNEMEIPTVKVPNIKLDRMPNKTDLVWNTKERKTSQASKWRKGVRAAVKGKMDSKLASAPEVKVRGKRAYYLAAGKDVLVVGSSSKVKTRAMTPTWNSSAAGSSYDIDHIQEDQLTGADEFGNLWLWDSSANRSSGSVLKNEIAGKINDLLDKSRTDTDGLADNTPSFDQVKSSYKVTFKRAEGGLGVSGNPGNYWTREDILAGKHVDKLRLLDNKEIAEVQGEPTELSLFTSSSGGQLFKIKPWEAGQTSASGNYPMWDSVDVSTVNFDENSGEGSVSAKALEKSQWFDAKPLNLKIKPQQGVVYGGYIADNELKSQLGNLQFKSMSLLVINEASLTPGKGISARGKLNPSIPLISKADVDVEIDGNDVNLSKTLTAGDFDFPKPLKVTDASVTLSVGTGGFSAGGKAAFELEEVGKGELNAEASTRNGFSAEGKFDFDSELFDPAHIKVWYRSDKFGGEGNLGIKDGKVKGVKSASLQVKVQEGLWEADGTVEPKVPGVKEGKLGVKFDPNGGMEISGRLELGGDIPRLKGGHLQATVEKGEEGWGVSGTGSADLDIPGVDAGVSIEYDNGLFKAEAKVGYERGIASGKITAGVTNMPVGDDGRPAGDPGDDLTVYGAGSVTLRFTPWLEGTAGIKLDQTGRMTVTGKVAIPDTIEVFPEKKLEKELLSVGVDLPIFGVAVAGQRIGIFLNISGNVSARAAIGPGELREAEVEITYDPEDESSAKVSGSARFVIPADAGLRLAISGSIGAGIPVVSAQAGLEVGGELGVEGEAAAAAQVEWTPQTGINMDAEVSLIAQPKFTFDVTGFVEVTADLLLTEIDLYSKRWQLAAVEFGSSMQVGAKLPVKVENNEFKDLSINDVEFITPEVDPIDVAKNLIKEIA